MEEAQRRRSVRGSRCAGEARCRPAAARMRPACHGPLPVENSHASCAAGLFKTAVTMSFSSTVILQKNTRAKAPLMKMPCVTRDARGQWRSEAESGGCPKEPPPSVIRVHANYVFNVVLVPGASIYLGHHVKAYWPIKELSSTNVPSTRTLRAGAASAAGRAPSAS